MNFINKLCIPPSLIFYCFALMILLYLFLPNYNYIIFPYNLAGLLVAFSGFMLMGKAQDLFRKHATTLAIEKSKSLIREGVFSKTRNPMYIGMFILLLGFSIFSTNLFALILPFLFLIIVRYIFIRKEERMMADTFGVEYLAYKKEVRRWI